MLKHRFKLCEAYLLVCSVSGGMLTCCLLSCAFMKSQRNKKKAMSPLHILAAGNGVLQAVWLHSKCDSVWVFLSSGQPCSGLGASFLEKHMLCACPHNFVDIPLFFFFETLFTCVLGSILERGHWVLRFFFCLFEPIITIVAVCVCVCVPLPLHHWVVCCYCDVLEVQQQWLNAQRLVLSTARL